MTHIPMADWARARGLRVGLVSRMIREGLIPAVSVAGRMHIPADLPAPELPPRARPVTVRPAPPTPEGCVPLQEWAARHGVSVGAAYAMAARGEVPVTTVMGPRRLFVRADLTPPVHVPAAGLIPVSAWAELHGLTLKSAQNLIYKRRLPVVRMPRRGRRPFTYIHRDTPARPAVPVAPVPAREPQRAPQQEHES